MPGAAVTEPTSVTPILEHFGLPTEPPRVAPARAPPELSFDFDQGLHYDPSAPEPVPDESRDGRVRAKQAGIVPDNPCIPSIPGGQMPEPSTNSTNA